MSNREHAKLQAYECPLDDSITMSSVNNLKTLSHCYITLVPISDTTCIHTQYI